MKSRFIIGLAIAAAVLASCAGNTQVGAITEPTSATTNFPGSEYPKINPDLSATFRNDMPQAQSVSVNVGGKNYQMTKGEDGIWEVTTDPLVPGFHYYTMNVDGKRIADPNSRQYFGSFYWSSGIEVPEAGVDYYLEKDVPHGAVEIVRYDSKLTGAARECYVYLPPQYISEPERRFPVLYLMHGAGEDETGWATQGMMANIMDNLIAEGGCEPMIIVCEHGVANLAGETPSGRFNLFNFDAFEKMMVEESVAESIMIISHGRRCATRWKTPASMYSSSEGIMAAIFLMSSVFSS